VRELENVIQRAVVMAPGDTVQAGDTDWGPAPASPPTADPTAPPTFAPTRRPGKKRSPFSTATTQLAWVWQRIRDPEAAPAFPAAAVSSPDGSGSRDPAP